MITIIHWMRRDRFMYLLFFLLFVLVLLLFLIDKINPTELFIIPKIHRVKAKIARTAEELRRGLMYVTSLQEDEGMLFDYAENGIHYFWMKNTYIPLDVIYLDRNFMVIGMVENNKPHDEKTAGINKNSKSFLEVHAGYVKKQNVKIGDKIEINEINDFST